MQIKDLVESYGIELKKTGNLYLGFCPFHDDKNTPNFYVYPHTNSWFCYKENIGGDILLFIAKMEHVERYEVAKKLAFNILKQKLEGVNTQETNIRIDFKDETCILISRICYNFLNKNPRRLDDVLYVLKKTDEKMKTLPKVSYTESIDLLDKFKNYLENYRSILE